MSSKSKYNYKFTKEIKAEMCFFMHYKLLYNIIKLTIICHLQTKSIL